MSGPLSPQSLSAHNRMENVPTLHERIKSPTPGAKSLENGIDKNSYIGNGPPSSPFQSEVDQENRNPIAFTSPGKGFSPLKSQPAPVNEFALHDDELIDDSIFLFSSQNTPARLPKPSDSQSKPPSAKKLPATAYLIKDRSCSMVDERAPPPSLFDIDYSKVSRHRDDIRKEFDTGTVISEDTCFSTFSAIPNADMTLFANIGNLTTGFGSGSPRRKDHSQNQPRNVTPRTANPHRITSRSPSQTPQPAAPRLRDGDTTNLLLDFTQQFDSFPQRTQQTPQKRGGMSPTRMHTDSNLLSYINNQRVPSPSKSHPTTPGAGRRGLLNLLDFDLPPQPTPRSIPTITVRELESLKSSYLSEISSLNASLSGKEAEVESLKKAVTDAERRVGEALETIRDERSAREHAEQERREWEKKGKEVESVLQSVKDEFENTEKEREELLQKLEDSNRAREEAELRAAEAVAEQSAEPSTNEDQPAEKLKSDTEALVAQRVAHQLDEKMENLARELHAVYKKKHESKVATLKKTYEARSEKKCHELQQKVEELTQMNQGPGAGAGGNIGANVATNRELEAELETLLDQIEQMRRTQEQLVRDLENERSEKGDLVAAVDEMLALQADSQASTAQGSAVVEGFRKSISLTRPSGLRAPGGFGPESRIGKMGASAPSLERASSAKSRMMHNIERMGGGGGRTTE